MRMIALSASLLTVAITIQSTFGADGSGTYGAYGTNFFAESTNTYYSGYQQAWRYLGWYVKCGDPSDRYDGSGSQDHQDSHENSHDSGDNNRWYGANNWCQRYLIWASYVDENYQGGGTGEYAYYDPYERQWDTSACDTHGNGRCAPMDCHMNNSTTWRLMGVFKEASYFGNDAFFEQLFKHEGVCVWNDDDLYDFMSEARENNWPQGCVSTGIQLTNAYYSDLGGDYIYIDLKPTYNGNMTYGLYTDSTCKYEYELADTNVEDIAKSMGLLYGDYLETWNDGLEIYKVCQPCKTSNLKNNYYQGNYDGGDDGYDPNEGYFECDDDAGYTNVNQCMKFRTHAELEVATWEDLVTATNQGGILQVNISGTIFGSERMSAEEYGYLVKMRQAEIKRKAAQASQVRLEQQQVEAMAPTARSWLGMGGLFLGSGLASLIGALFLLRKQYIERTNPHLLTQPLIMSKRHGGSAKRLLGRPNVRRSGGKASPASIAPSRQIDDDDGVLAKDSPTDIPAIAAAVKKTQREILPETLERKDSMVSSVSDGSNGTEEKAKAAQRSSKSKKGGFRLFKGKTPKVEAARSVVDEVKPAATPAPDTNPVVRTGAFEMNPDGTPFFQSQDYLSDDNDLFVDEPVELVKPPARTGAIEMSDDGLPFFQSHSYLSDDPKEDVVQVSEAPAVNNKAPAVVEKKQDDVDFVLQARSSDYDDAELMRSRSSDA